MLYYFKVFGDHSFVQFSFDEIKNNISILQNINPVDLIKIINQEINNEQKRNLIKIKEHLRNNQYKIGDELTTGLHSGDEICDNIILMSRMNNLDIYKIAYNTGFIRGRSLTKSLAKEIHDNAQEARLFKLALVTNNELHQVIQNNVSNT